VLVNEIVNKFKIDDGLNQSIDQAAKIFFNGGVFIYPTDTIYGFGGNPFNENVLQRISQIKQRKEWKRYIHLVGSIEILLKYVDIKYEEHYDFLLRIWPNPISVVLRVNAQTKKIFKSDTMTFRIPNHKFCLKLLEQLKMPLISTSVNHFGQEPLNSHDLIIQEFGKEVDAVFYSEKKSFFVASTLIDLSNEKPYLIREGKIKFDEILKRFKNKDG
jgi:L-threonylcarbamoyladenylate synthase